MYGENYGYRSGLNPTMVNHLKDIVRRVTSHVDLRDGDTVIDIGSNDGTTLGFFQQSLNLIGIDPSSEKFAKYYRDDITRLPEFFSAHAVSKHLKGNGAKLILSIAMMYDLEDPLDFALQVARCLSPDGVWLFEQSYLPTMVENLAYDTVCHEHIEYYSMAQLVWIVREAGLKVVDVNFNSSNGGSIAITAALKDSSAHSEYNGITDILLQEKSRGFRDRYIYDRFADRVSENKIEVLNFLSEFKKSGLKVAGLGASTKGNVLLQYLGLNEGDLFVIGDINPDKDGCVTPGTLIPIVSESECLRRKPDILFVLPWHFREFFEGTEHLSEFSLFFPLPNPQLIMRQ
jgi:NDP-4-keto-2,6-dideoxyhexose 3-C-methyltransferase